MDETMKNSCILKHKEIVLESLREFQRKGNYIRIFPGKNSNMYDQYFQGVRSINRILYKVLYSSKLLKYQS